MPIAPQSLYSQLWERRRKQKSLQSGLKCSQGLWRRHFWWQTVPCFAAATGNAQSPIVESRVSGTASAEVDDERRRCRPRSPATGTSDSLQNVRQYGNRTVAVTVGLTVRIAYTLPA